MIELIPGKLYRPIYQHIRIYEEYWTPKLVGNTSIFLYLESTFNLNPECGKRAHWFLDLNGKRIFFLTINNKIDFLKRIV